MTCRGTACICIHIHSHREREASLKTNNRAGTTENPKPVVRTDYGAAVFTAPPPQTPRNTRVRNTYFFLGGPKTFPWYLSTPQQTASCSQRRPRSPRGRATSALREMQISRTFPPWGCADHRSEDTPHTVRVPAFADDLRGLPPRLPLQRAFLVVREPHLLSRRDVARSDECELSQEVL